jgi:hypothetical protein
MNKLLEITSRLNEELGEIAYNARRMDDVDAAIINTLAKGIVEYARSKMPKPKTIHPNTTKYEQIEILGWNACVLDNFFCIDQDLLSLKENKDT